MIPNLADAIYSMVSRKIGRRDFIKSAFALGAAAFLAGCAQQPSSSANARNTASSSTPTESEVTKQTYREGWPKYTNEEWDVGLPTYPGYRFIDGIHEAYDTSGKQIPEAEIERREDAVWYMYVDRETLQEIDKIKYKYPVLDVTDLLNERPEKILVPRTSEEWARYLCSFLPENEEEAQLVKTIPTKLNLEKFERYEDLKKYSSFMEALEEGIPPALALPYHRARLAEEKKYILSGFNGAMGFWVDPENSNISCGVVLLREVIKDLGTHPKNVLESWNAVLPWYAVIPLIKLEMSELGSQTKNKLYDPFESRYKREDIESALSIIYLTAREHYPEPNPDGIIEAAILTVVVPSGKPLAGSIVQTTPPQRKVLRELFESAYMKML